MPNVRIIAKGQRGDSLTKLKVNFAPSQSSAPSLYAETNTVYLTRPTEGTGELMELVGGTVAWNQLCNSSSVTGTSGHKFYLKKSGAESITNTNTFTGLASGTDMVTDLTLMLGSAIADYVYSLEQATAGSGVTWLKSYDLIDDQYHAYSAPTLQSVEASAHVLTGKNIFGGETFADAVVAAVGNAAGAAKGSDSDGDYLAVVAGAYVNNEPFTPSGMFEPDTQYTIICKMKKNNTNASTNIGIRYTDGTIGYVDARGSIVAGEMITFAVTTIANKSVDYLMTLWGSGTAYLYYDYVGVFKGVQAADEFEAYTKRTYPTSPIPLRGMLRTDANGNLYYEGDTYEWDGTVTRYFGERAYQAGDESLTDAITDGTNTVYKLTTPTTESADPFTAVQTVEDGGMEEFTTSNGVPVGVVGRFANAVPMDGVDSFTVTADDGTTHTYPVSLSEEIYSGVVDMLTGEAVSDMASIAEYNGETISEPWLSSLDVYSAGATPTNGAQVVYPITPEEVTATITGDPTELGKVTSASSTEGTVEWSAMAPLDGKCIVRVVS